MGTCKWGVVVTKGRFSWPSPQYPTKQNQGYDDADERRVEESPACPWDASEHTRRKDTVWQTVLGTVVAESGE